MHYLLRHTALVFPNLGVVCQGDTCSVSCRRGERTAPKA